MPATEIIVIGASAGGVEASSSLVERLPANLNAAVFLVLHFPENATSVLPRILNRHRTLVAKHPEDGDRIEKSHVYVAPPGMHMLIKHGHIRLIRGPKENGHRPAIDPLFRTAAHVYGDKVAAVMLSGLLDDGVMGALAVKAAGGKVLVQDPEEALFPDMPRNTMAAVKVDQVCKLADLATELSCLAGATTSDDLSIKDGQMDDKPDITEMGGQDLSTLHPNPQPSFYTCPECNGTLFEVTNNGVKHFRCRVGHAYTHESLEVHQTEELEAALWESLRAMEENLSLCRSLLERAAKSERKSSVKYYTGKVGAAEGRVRLLRSVLNSTMMPTGNTEGP